MEPTKSAMRSSSPARGRLRCRVGWSMRLRLGIGHASTVRPDPSTPSVVGERGSHHEDCSQSGSGCLSRARGLPPRRGPGRRRWRRRCAWSWAIVGLRGPRLRRRGPGGSSSSGPPSSSSASSSFQVAAAWICTVLVASSLSGVTRPSGWARGWRVPAYTRPAPLRRASATSACPMPRLAPVTRTALSAIVITPSCMGGARRTQSPLLEVVIRRTAAIHRPPRKLHRRRLTPAQAWIAAVWAVPSAGSTLAAGIPLTDFCSGGDGFRPQRGSQSR
jgi:hypothetical protein